MPIAADYRLTLIAAEKVTLATARDADGARNVLRQYRATLGRRTHGRLFLGRSSAELRARRESGRATDPGPED